MKNFQIHFRKDTYLVVKAESSTELHEELRKLSDRELNNLLCDSKWEIAETAGPKHIQDLKPHSVLYKGLFLHPHDVPTPKE